MSNMGGDAADRVVVMSMEALKSSVEIGGKAAVSLATFLLHEIGEQKGKSKGYAAVCLEGAVVLLACIIYNAFASSPPVVDASAPAVTQVWGYVGELIFNMLVLVGGGQDGGSRCAGDDGASLTGFRGSSVLV